MKKNFPARIGDADRRRAENAGNVNKLNVFLTACGASNIAVIP